MLDIAVCDDDAAQVKRVSDFLTKWSAIRSEPARVRSFSSAEELISSVQSGVSYDIFILDIILPGADGIDLGLMLRKSGQSGIIIYLTSSPDFAIESYEVHAFQYVLKPISEPRLLAVLDDALKTIRSKPSRGIQVKTKDGIVHVSTDDILYAELSKRNVRYMLKHGYLETTSIREPFAQAVSTLLEDERFYLCGASYALNLSEIKSVVRNAALFNGGYRVQLPASACQGLRSAWSDYWLREPA